MRGIVDAAAYLPEFRLDANEIEDVWGTSHARGVETKAVASADEDALTMAVAAGREVLERSDVSRSDVDYLGIATTTPPMEEEMLAGRVRTMLGLNDSITPHSATQSPLAWAQLLSGALDADGIALVLVGDAPEGELPTTDHGLGAGGAAFIVSNDPSVPVSSQHSNVEIASGIRYRERASTDVESLDITSYERAAIRESITSALEGLDVELEAVDAAAIHQPNGSLPYRLTGDVPLEARIVANGVVADTVGDAGAATVPLGLIAALDDADDDTLTVAADFGGGGASIAFAFEGGLETNMAEVRERTRTVTYDEYLRQRGYIADPEIAGGGVNVSLPTWQRSLEQRYRLRVGRCPDCGELAFPPEGSCPACQERVDFEPVELSPEGTIEAFTTIEGGGAPPEFIGQQERGGRFGVAIVSVDDGEDKVKLPAQITDANLERLAIGDVVRGVIRHVYSQEGLPRYGLKFTDTPSTEDGE